VFPSESRCAHKSQSAAKGKSKRRLRGFAFPPKLMLGIAGNGL
jgi:hypothetical protein